MKAWSWVLIMLLTISAYAEDDITLDTVTVTAQKYEQAENKTPVSSTVFSDIDIEEKNISTLKDLSMYSANVSVKADNVGNSTVIRGMAPLTATMNGPAGIFIDGIAMPSVFMQQPNIYDISRVEILKGPQGTLYGRNTESGVINIISSKPGNNLSMGAEAEYYFFDNGDTPYGTKFKFNVSGPVVEDKLFAGISFATDKNQGYYTNEFNEDDEAGELNRKDISLKLRSTPNQKTEIYLSSYYFDADDKKGKFRYTQGANATDEYTINYNDRYSQDYNGSVNSLNISYSFANIQLSSLTGITAYSRNFSKDFDGSASSRGLTNFSIDDESYSEELRISSTDTKTKWILGLYGFKENSETLFEKTFMQDKRKANINTSGAAVFGQISPRITKKIYADIGMRIEQTHLDVDMNRNFKTAGLKYSDDEDFFEFLPKLSLNYETETGIIYLSAAKGYLAGGANYNLATSDETLIYDEEETMNYELGFKSVLGKGRLKISAALFYIDMKDKQVTQILPGEMGSMKVDNAADAHSYGAEVEFKAVITKGLEFFTSAGYTKTEADEWVDSQYNNITRQDEYYDYSGNNLPYAPEYTFTAGLQYIHTNGLFIAGEAVSTGAYYHDGANKLKEDGNTLFNLRTGYIGKNIELTVWFENLLDKRYTETQTLWGSVAVVEDAQPRTIGIKAGYRF
ncbi:TonB-dependent receptor [Denitrovibrio acetiphilus DSM 12809]|uniref:TonB-dependent receptor n=1 Tax=Denitrovibrio acetiphilus (strain DSM 12809 / NBRC 114555 / N2460) TaxID=522772 RepID=D4H1S6_DENA2|nr:TonB-dependent receptor [Denitrovibrio acetiphilus]ADD68836.1 TonB-dependent receptor [Denitrovibrio acetiphilus DSM 12809]